MKPFSEPWMGNCKRENEKPIYDSKKPIYDSRSVSDRLLLWDCIGAVRLQGNVKQKRLELCSSLNYQLVTRKGFEPLKPP